MPRSGVVLLVLVSISLPTYSLELKTRKKPQTIEFRIAAVTERVFPSSFSSNRETYLAYMTGKATAHKAVKIVFRYLGYEDGLSNQFADFDLVHTFKAVRDRSCDEPWQSFSTRFTVGKDGNPLPVVITRYVAPNAVQDIPADQVLACYVITPQGYKNSKLVRIPQENPQTAEGK